MNDTPDTASSVISRRPSVLISTLVVVALAAAWGSVRVIMFKHEVASLTFVLPLMICIWTRRTWQLLLMGVFFLGLATFKSTYLMPEELFGTPKHWLFLATTVTNLAIGCAVVQALIVFRNRMDDSRRAILTQNHELESQAEEMAQQNEEIRAQGEELAEQNEQVESQSEELERQNGELQELNTRLISRESVLQAIVESVNGANACASANTLDEVCRRTLEVMGTSAEAVALMEVGEEALSLRANARIDTQPPLRPTWPLEGSLAKVVLREDRTAYVDDLHERPDLASPFFEHGSVRSLLATPVRIGGRQVGLLVVCARGVTHWSRDQFRLVEWVAAQCGLIMEGLRHREELDRRANELETANRTKDRFMAMLSHELRTPLTPVLAAAASIESDVRLPEDVRDDVMMIRRNVGIQSRLIDDLLDLARVNNGKLHLHREMLPLANLLKQAAGIVTCDLDARNMTLGLSIDLPPDAAVDGDSARLQQVIWNLLKNAIKFSKPGSRLQVNARREANDRVAIDVVDNGQGIADEDQERIFLAFEQAEGEAATSGLGLGLCIARAIVEQHGGRLSVHSAGVGRGSTFTVELPLVSHAPASNPSDTLDSTPSQLADPASGTARILLVEDHADTAKVLKRLLTILNYEVQHASSISAAKALASAEPFDLVVSDLGLPDGTGIEMMRDLRLRHPQLLGICLSGFGMESDIESSRDAGFAEHLIKPVELTELQSAIARVLASQKVRNFTAT